MSETEPTVKILFTSVGRRVELLQMYAAAARELGIRLRIFGADLSQTAPALWFCDERISVPGIADAGYIPALLDCCRTRGIDALIPTIDTELLLLSEERERFAEVGTRVVVSEPEKIKLCRDKRLTADYFHSVGLLSPDPSEDVTRYRGGFPAFIKPRDGSSSAFAYRVENEKELTAFAERVPRYIIQPYIDGVEYTVDAFCDFEGNPIYITPRIRHAVRAGEVQKTEIVQDPTMIQAVKRLLADYRPCGPITIQLIREKGTNRDFYLEINPRYGGGAPLTMRAGANSASAMLCLLCGQKLAFCPDAAEDGAVYSRFDQSVRVK